MKLSLTSLSVFLGLVVATEASAGTKIFDRAKKLKGPVIEKRRPNAPFSDPRLEKRNSPYLTEKTKKFVVNGTNIPEVDFDVGESYAGLLPISDAEDETRELFFWFFPSTNPEAADEITMWFNGGPGCSSLSGFLTENGPFTWEAGTLQPVQNPYTWVNLTNMVWVEQPVGVGYTQGVPNITNEVELGQQMLGFYKNFVETFDVHNRKVYLTGESYAGFYVPYIADAFIGANDSTYYNLAGVAINDPIIGDGTMQQQVVIAPFVDYWSELFYFNESFTQQLHDTADSCGYTDYIEKYYTFPPPEGKFPVLPDPFTPQGNESCDVFDLVYNAVLLTNPCFNIYHITETCPHPWSVLGIVNTGDYLPPDEVVYFNRTDVQKAINAPVGTNWMQCTEKNVFGNGSNNPNITDTSLGPAQDGVLTRVIDTLNNTWIGSGNLDFILPNNGTIFALQNLTWGGKQGFDEFPATHDFFVPYHPEYNLGALSSAGKVGTWASARGLTFYQVQLGGHELPGYAPGAGYRMLEAMLGRITDLSQPGTFTTQKGDFEGTPTVTSKQDRLSRYRLGEVYKNY